MGFIVITYTILTYVDAARNCNWNLNHLHIHKNCIDDWQNIYVIHINLYYVSLEAILLYIVHVRMDTLAFCTAQWLFTFTRNFVINEHIRCRLVWSGSAPSSSTTTWSLWSCRSMTTWRRSPSRRTRTGELWLVYTGSRDLMITSHWTLGQPPPPHRGAHPRHRRHRAEEDHRAGLPHRPHQPHEEAEEAAESALGHPGPLLPAGGLRLQVQQRHGDCHQLLRHRPHL